MCCAPHVRILSLKQRRPFQINWLTSWYRTAISPILKFFFKVLLFLSIPFSIHYPVSCDHVSSSYLNNSESLIRGKSCQVSISRVRETASQSSPSRAWPPSHVTHVTEANGDTLTIDKDPLWNTSPCFLPSRPIIVTIPTISLSPLRHLGLSS